MLKGLTTLPQGLRFFANSVPPLTTVRYFLPRTEALKLFAEVKKRKKGHSIDGLDVTWTPAKLTTSLQILDIEAKNVAIDGYGNYTLSLTRKEQQKVIGLAEIIPNTSSSSNNTCS